MVYLEQERKETMDRNKKKKERQRRSVAHKMTFERYLKKEGAFDLPPVNASTEVLTAYVSKYSPMVEGHEDEVGSGELAWCLGKVLTWLKERCDEGQLDMGDGTKSTYIPPEFRTFSGEPMLIRVHSVEEMEKLANEKMQEHGLAGLGTKDDDEITCPRVLLVHPCTHSLSDPNLPVVVEIQVDSSVPDGQCERDDPGEDSP